MFPCTAQQVREYSMIVVFAHKKINKRNQSWVIFRETKEDFQVRLQVGMKCHYFQAQSTTLNLAC